MRAVAGAVGGAAVGGLLGWFLPGVLAGPPHEFEALGLLALQALGAGAGATLGLVVGGALAARGPGGGSPRPGEQTGREGNLPPPRPG